jgi:hypothetical protein
MLYQPTTKQIVINLAIFAGLVLLTTRLTTGSFNPVAVYRSGNAFAMVVVSLLGAFVVAGLLGLLGRAAARKAISAASGGQPAEDVICPGCGQPLLRFVGSHGNVVRCVRCRRLWHNGPACFRRGAVRARLLVLCPDCRADATSDRDLFDRDEM